jgi:hypothetical protein
VDDGETYTQSCRDLLIGCPFGGVEQHMGPCHLAR